MSFNIAAVLAEIDGVLAKYEEVWSKYKRKRDYGEYWYISGPEPVLAEIMTLLCQTVVRLAPVPEYGRTTLEHMNSTYDDQIMVYSGVLRALRDDYAAGRILSVQERIRSDVFSDFLETAEYLIGDEGMKDPAAVLAGGVLEQHPRKLCEKHAVLMAAKPKMSMMNIDLAKKGVYGKNEQKQVDAWAGIRNSAAHAQYDAYNADQVKLMIAGIRDFLGRYPT